MSVNILNTGFFTTNDLFVSLSQDEKISYFETKLRETNREGIESVIDFLKRTDFYTAPSSTSYHSNYDGGLLDHSILVYTLAMRFREQFIEIKPELADRLSVESITISALLHDICKTCFYKKVLKWRKNVETGQWESYEGYEIDDNFPIGHGEKSVIMLQNFGLKLTPDEMIAIRFHMGSWDGAILTNDLRFSYSTSQNMCPLMTLLQIADNSSSLLLEYKKEN
jgi:hypothetical protein